MGKKSILIVDDNEFFIQQQIGCLGGNRFDLHTAGSGKQALEKVRSQPPDLVLLDMFMEDMTGPQVARIIKDDPATSRIPIVIVSSGEIEASRRETALANCDGVIFKPIRRDLLVAMVEEILGMVLRQWKRVTISLPCKILSRERETGGTIHSIGGGGAFVEGDLTLMCGDTCRLKFNLLSPDRYVEVSTAAVVWKGKLNGTEKEGVGVRFLTISHSDQEAIDEYVGTLLEIEK